MRTLSVVLYKSRNKDNKDVPNFKERSYSYVVDSEYDLSIIKRDFHFFAGKGVDAEKSRLYISNNDRNALKVHRQLQHLLVDDPHLPLPQLPQKIASIASKKENSASSEWMFDYDAEPSRLQEFITDVYHESGIPLSMMVISPTVSGFFVSVPHGFDTRALLSKWVDVGLHRDGMCFYEQAQFIGGGVTSLKPCQQRKGIVDALYQPADGILDLDVAPVTAYLGREG